MAENIGQSRFAFLYRTDAGRIDRATWWRGVIALVLPLAILTVIWIAIAPFARRDLTRSSALVDPRALAAYIYLLFYAFAVILIAVCWYNLTAKRFRARNRPPSLAGLVPLLALLAGAAHWLVPRSEGMMPEWAALIIDVLLAGVVIYTLWELGLAPEDEPSTHAS